MWANKHLANNNVEEGEGVEKGTLTTHPVMCFHFRKVGLLLQGAVCIRRANASICPIDALSKIASIEVRRTSPASGKTFWNEPNYRMINVHTGSTDAGKVRRLFLSEGEASRGRRNGGKITLELGI